jgi:co-chaperonin GroES (HSP10)|tara:strand:+ start:144 stop:407 length:264 start_codon:yes stop_codon:yes gene_type:complete
MKFKPNGSWVVLPDPSKKTTDSGIILDDTTAKSITTNILEILAAGPQCHFAKVGDTVMVDPRAEAMIVHIDDIQYIMISEHQLLGKW